MSNVPQFERLIASLNTIQRETLATLAKTEAEFILEEIEGGNLDLFLDCCTVADASDINTLETLFDTNEGLYDFVYNFFFKIVGKVNYKYFTLAVKPMCITVSPTMYKEFKKYCCDTYDNPFSNSNIFSDSDLLSEKEKKTNENNETEDFWSRKPQDELE